MVLTGYPHGKDQGAGTGLPPEKGSTTRDGGTPFSHERTDRCENITSIVLRISVVNIISTSVIILSNFQFEV